MERHRNLAVIWMLVFATILVGRQPSAKPNFSGTWKLNTRRSGPTLPRGLTGLLVVIDHEDPSTVRITSEVLAGKPGVTAIFGNDPAVTIDGKDHVISFGENKSVRVNTRWSGNDLLRHQAITIMSTRYISDTRTTLSAGGTILTIVEHYREPNMKRIRSWVFERQSY
jgi:hypothetical protein